MYYEDAITIENHATGHWFSKNTMRAFSTRLHATAYSADDRTYFLPYSNSSPSGRRYGVVCFRKEGRTFHHVYRSDLSSP